MTDAQYAEAITLLAEIARATNNAVSGDTNNPVNVHSQIRRLLDILTNCIINTPSPLTATSNASRKSNQ